MKTPEGRKRISEGLSKAWQDPEFRKRMQAIQKKNGLRTYDSFIPAKRKYKAPTLEEYLTKHGI